MKQPCSSQFASKLIGTATELLPACSRRTIMNNIEKQSDEILALQSIFDRKFRLLDDNQYELLIDFDLITPITVRWNDQIATIKYLPPFSLIIHYHEEYPSDDPPSFILSCFYLSKFHLQNLCQKLDRHPFEQGEVCVYDWIDLIQHEITHELVLDQEFVEQENDPRALNGYSIDNAEKIFRYLINYHHQREQEQFHNQLQICGICTDVLRGDDCIRLHRCRHFYCRSCLNNYVRMTLDNGKYGERLLCPQDECKQAILPTEIKAILGNDELYEKYEKFTLQHGLESMNDIVWCPRCQSAVLVNSGEDKLALCEQCRYSFCKQCKEIFHSQTICPKDYLVQQLQLRQEKERERIEREKKEALAQLAKAQQEKQSSSAQKRATQKYRQIVIKLSDQEALLEEILNAERIESNTQACPKCNVRIEKNGGCSHMHCSRCDHDFTWKTIVEPDAANETSLLNSYVRNSERIQSIKEQVNKVASTVNTPAPETASAIDEEQDSDQQEEDHKISIDNRSTIGSAIVNRVRQCPHRSCKKLNAKIDRDNWIVCSGCMRQYCFLCVRQVHGTRHFEKKCERYTSI